MYNSQKIANRIRSTAKQQGKSLGEVLYNCELGKNTVSKIEKGNDILTLNFAKIADYLDCSVDYLLGRTDSPEIAGGIHISSGNGNVIAGGMQIILQFLMEVRNQTRIKKTWNLWNS